MTMRISSCAWPASLILTAIIPRGVRIGRNVKIAGDVKANDFPSRTVKSGASIEPGTAKRRSRAAVEARIPVALEPSTNGHREPAAVTGARRAIAGAGASIVED